MKQINDENYFWQNDLVRLRAKNETDFREHYSSLFDTNGRRVLNYEVELPESIDSHQKGMEKFIDFAPGTGRLMFGVGTHDEVTVGGLNLNSINEKNGTFSIGIQIYKEHRGKGYGTAAMEILLRYAFYERRLNKMNNSVIEGNHASLMMFKKLGAKEEGFRRETVFMQGKYWGETQVGITRADFEELYPPKNEPMVKNMEDQR